MDHWNRRLDALPGETRAAMEFLRASLPQSDLDCYPFSLFLAFAGHALTLRAAAPWCGALDEELFYHYVLCPRVNDEDLSFHRALFYASLRPRVAGLTAEAAVLEVNRWCCEHASYQAQDDRTASPLTVFRSGSGRCGEESAFLVSALRSVGLAARQVYAPRWSHCDDNHAWAEALVDGEWRFLGACEPEPVLDRGWFNAAAARAVLVHSRTFGCGKHPLHGALLGVRGGAARYNQTPRYADTSTRRFRVTRDGAGAGGAKLTLCVLNEAAFRPVAVLTAGADGSASAELGRGDLWVRAEAEGLAAEGLSRTEDGTLELALSPAAAADGDWVSFGFRAPGAGAPPPPLDGARKAARAEVLARCGALRARRLAGFYDPARAAALPSCQDLLQDARGNFDEIHRFLSRDADPLREKLLRSLSAKDLRDVTADLLEDHLKGAAPFAAACPDELFVPCVLCPRIADEPLTAWRARLMEEPVPEVRLCPENYETLYWPPDAAYEAGRCGGGSRALLTVAILRARGVPARLRPLDGAVERWAGGAFATLNGEKTGTLLLKKDGEARFTYGLNWSLSRRAETDWALLNLAWAGWPGDELPLKLPAGDYRLVTTVRLPGGDQLALRRDISLAAGETRALPLRLREYALSDLLYARVLPSVPAEDAGGARLENALAAERPALLFWLEDGAEPTEHILNELDAAGDGLFAPGADIRFFLRSREAPRQRTLAALLERRPGIRLFFDDWTYDVEQLARLLGLDPERPPLAVVLDGGGRAVYAECGYRVGSVELLGRIARSL